MPFDVEISTGHNHPAGAPPFASCSITGTDTTQRYTSSVHHKPIKVGTPRTLGSWKHASRRHLLTGEASELLALPCVAWLGRGSADQSIKALVCRTLSALRLCSADNLYMLQSFWHAHMHFCPIRRCKYVLTTASAFWCPRRLALPN